jgi:hypothetical protein
LHNFKSSSSTNASSNPRKETVIKTTSSESKENVSAADEEMVKTVWKGFPNRGTQYSTMGLDRIPEENMRTWK